MNCESYLTLISGHLDGVNTKTEEDSLQAHLKTCEHCRELLTVMQENDALLKNTQVEIPADLTQRIMAQVRKTPKRNSKKPFYISMVTSGLAAAAILALVFFSKTGAPSLEVGQAETTTAQHLYSLQAETAAYGYAAEQDEEFEVSTGFSYDVMAQPAATGTTKRGNVTVGAAVLVVEADSADLALSGEQVTLAEIDAQLQKSEYELTGEETAAYMVTWEDLQQIAQEYEGVFAMEKYYSNDAYYTCAIIIFVE